ncbi:MAG: hypothetical protein ACRCTP_04260 [Aeromonas popoffii]|uniref:hypothetical protein n=1 Tax=Aeromonas popoffii TaxID=70856 RepID=UPI003F40CEE0
MNTITKLINTASNTVVVLNTEVSKAEQFRQATLDGAVIGRTSFMNLVNGKVEMACGWTLKVEEETVEAIAAETNEVEALEAVCATLTEKGLKANVKVANTEVYGTVVVEGLGRIQFNPTKKGLSLMFFPCKGAEVKDIAEKFEITKECAQYGRLATTSIKSFIEAL